MGSGGLTCPDGSDPLIKTSLDWAQMTEEVRTHIHTHTHTHTHTHIQTHAHTHIQTHARTHTHTHTHTHTQEQEEYTAKYQHGCDRLVRERKSVLFQQVSFAL